MTDTRILNETGVKTDFRGYAIVPYLTPYRYNEVMLDSETFADNVDMDITSQKLSPPAVPYPEQTLAVMLD